MVRGTQPSHAFPLEFTTIYQVVLFSSIISLYMGVPINSVNESSYRHMLSLILCITLTMLYFENMGILNVNTRAEQLHLNYVFNICHDVCPNYMKENVIRLSILHFHNTKCSTFNFQVSKIKTPSSCCFYYNAIKD